VLQSLQFWYAPVHTRRVRLPLLPPLLAIPAILALALAASACKRSPSSPSIDDWPAEAATKYRASSRTRLLLTGVTVGDFGQRDACTLDDEGWLTCVNPTSAAAAACAPPTAGQTAQPLPPQAPDTPRKVLIPVEVARATLDRAEASGLSTACHTSLRDAEKQSGKGPRKPESAHQEICRGDPTKDGSAACIKTCIPTLPAEVVALLPR